MKSPILLILVVSMFVSCKMVSKSSDRGMKLMANTAIKPLINKDLLLLQLSLRDYWVDHQRWSSDTSELREYFTQIDPSRERPFQHINFLDLKISEDTLKGQYKLEYTPSDSVNLKQLKGSFTMFCKSDTLAVFDNNPEMMKTEDGKEIYFPNNRIPYTSNLDLTVKTTHVMPR